MLNRLDDYPIHQTAEPLAHASTGDRNFYDRYFFNGYTPDADLFFAVALGLYPNRRVMDASISVVTEGEVQHSLHASRLAPLERTETSVGPIELEVVEPMAVQRIRVGANEHGIEGELTMHARSAALEEPRFTRRTGFGRLTMDSTRFAQFGWWEGWLSVEGRRFDLGPTTLGVRDRSWGVRGVGEREGGAPAEGMRQFYWLWAPTNFEDSIAHFGTNEDGDGHAWHANGVLAAADPDAAPRRTDAVTHEIEWTPGTRHARSARITIAPADEPARTLELEPLFNFRMAGIGYGHPEWGHGMWHGELAVDGERWRFDQLKPLDPRFLHVQAVCRAQLSGDGEESRRGIGVLEQLVIGPHAPSGFRDVLDGAP